MEYKLLTVPTAMKNDVCLICGKPDVNLLIVEDIPGGKMGTFHTRCCIEKI
jgi:hypothetical protein